jgi:hypothetical protein
MIGPRFVVAMALGFAVTSAPEAKVRCPEDVRLRTCIGVAAADTVRFCFASDLGCIGGVVLSLDPPSAPFSVTSLRVQDALGTRTIGPAAFPLTLLPGESLLVDVSATLTQASDVERTLELTLANTLPVDDPMGKNEGDVCDVKLRVRAPGCPTAGDTADCADEVCVDGECVDAPPGGACDDGDTCTRDDACTDTGCAGTPIPCDDGIACTQEICAAEGCLHEPTDALCDSGDCAVATCRPGDPAADARGCVQTIVGEGDACTDDGVPCTDDLCTSGACLHVPVDSRCAGAASCGGAACLPAAADADAAGCVAGPAGSEGGVCAEDGNPCSDDRCSGGTCQHQLVTQPLTCAPVENAFRRGLALLALTRSLAISTEAVAQPAVGRDERLTAPLARLDEELAGAVDALSGRTTVPILVNQATGLPETPAQARARAALLLAGRMPLEARSFIQALAATGRQGVARSQLHEMMDQARVLRRGVKRLKVELKRLRRNTVQFAR